MPSNRSSRIRTTLAGVVEMLVRKDYAGLESLSNSVRLKSEHIEAGVSDYGRTLINPPQEAYDNIDVIQVEGATPPEYSVRFNLFTKEEGLSDLEIQLTLIDDSSATDAMRVEIDGILVP